MNSPSFSYNCKRYINPNEIFSLVKVPLISLADHSFVFLILMINYVDHSFSNFQFENLNGMFHVRPVRDHLLIENLNGMFHVLCIFDADRTGPSFNLKIKNFH